MAIYKAELKRLNREAYAQRKSDPITPAIIGMSGSSYDQVEKTNQKIKTKIKRKSKRQRRYF